MRYIKVEYLAGKSLASLGTSNRSTLSLDTAPFQPNQRMLKVSPFPWFILIEICKRLLSSHCVPCRIHTNENRSLPSRSWFYCSQGKD